MMPAFRFAPHGREMLCELDRLVHEAYGAPEPLLGNQVDPLDETIYIILSFQTDLARFRATWQNLRRTFPSWSDVEDAPEHEVSAALRSGGLQHQKAKGIKHLLHSVRRQFGKLSLDVLREMSDAEAERVLTRLPGISWKGARCVLLYSLNRKVFPIDGNTFRILRRTGVTPMSTVYRRLSVHDSIQDAIDPSVRRRFHVNLAYHGQEVCLPQRPRCDACCATTVCPKRALPAQSRENILDQAHLLNALQFDHEESQGWNGASNAHKSIVQPIARGV